MIAFSINAEKGYVIISISGTPTIDDYVEAVESLKAHPNFYAGTHRICDFVDGDIDVTPDELTAFVEQARSLPLEHDTKTAFVTDDPMERRVIDRFSEHFQRGEFRTFQTGRDALAWILFSPRAIQKASDRVRIHRLMGDVTTKDVLAMQNSWFNQQGFDQDAPILWDLRQARLKVEVEALLPSAQKMMAASRERRPNGKAAALVSSTFHESVLRSSFNDGVKQGRLFFFFSEEDAYEFLLGG